MIFSCTPRLCSVLRNDFFAHNIGRRRILTGCLVARLVTRYIVQVACLRGAYTRSTSRRVPASTSWFIGVTTLRSHRLRAGFHYSLHAGRGQIQLASGCSWHLAAVFDGFIHWKLPRGMGDQCVIGGLAEHSPRQGGTGFLHYVVRRDVLHVYKTYT